MFKYLLMIIIIKILMSLSYLKTNQQNALSEQNKTERQ